eukprot:gnl/Chilomastix_caulleri/4509.p1 GENE.gnl/Chilomastix_caulleri/4509~~gnl/Chilomastix_caulleri/4509.p1  ORF type:complete len:87 (+),score=10.95 gnl/Chilomastix_caulleri/4509:124-384(+)
MKDIKSVASMYYHGAKAAIAVYDITSKESLGKLKSYLDTFIDISGGGTSDGLIIILVGNKSDLESQRRSYKRRRRNICKRTWVFIC